jgi:peptide/nickel transport system permease protein
MSGGTVHAVDKQKGGLLTESRKEKLSLLYKSVRGIADRYRKNLSGVLGLSILMFFVIMAVFAPYLANFENPKSISWVDVNPPREAPSSEFWFGTDFYGRDIWSLTVWGARASLIVGLMASLISIVLGTTVGLLAGYFGKFSDEVLMRFTDFFLVLPWLPLMIVFAMVMGRSFTNIIIVIGITSWPSTARIVRAQVLSVKEKMFIQRAKCVGSGDLRIIRKHILPNVVPLIFANTILLIANSIFSESFLEFFNLGDPDVISWGTMLEESYSNGDFNSPAWWDFAAPGACIVILIMAFYLIGDALDEVLNPKLRKR